MLNKYIFGCTIKVSFCNMSFGQDEICLDVKIESGTDAEVQAQAEAALAPVRDCLMDKACGFHRLCELCDSSGLSDDE